MPYSQHQQTVIDTLHLDLDLYTDLHELLQGQQQFILRRDHQSLSQTAESITTLMLQARENRKKRSEAMKHLQMQNTQTGMAQFLHHLQHPDKQGLQEDWDELMDLVEDCRQVNQVNDQALTMQHKLTERALNQLRVEEKGAETYSSTGQETLPNRSVLNIQA